jgi:hypothetical protein
MQNGKSNIEFIEYFFSQKSLAFVKNFKMQKILHILEEQKIIKIWLPKINSKWPLNSR